MLSAFCGLLYNLGVAGVLFGGTLLSDMSHWLNHHYFLISCMTGNRVPRGHYHGMNLLPVLL